MSLVPTRRKVSLTMAAAHGYELKVARRVVQKYGGSMATEPRGELFAVKIVLPPAQS